MPGRYKEFAPLPAPTFLQAEKPVKRNLLTLSTIEGANAALTDAITYGYIHPRDLEFSHRKLILRGMRPNYSSVFQEAITQVVKTFKWGETSKPVPEEFRDAMYCVVNLGSFTGLEVLVNKPDDVWHFNTHLYYRDGKTRVGEKNVKDLIHTAQTIREGAQLDPFLPDDVKAYVDEVIRPKPYPLSGAKKDLR